VGEVTPLTLTKKELVKIKAKHKRRGGKTSPDRCLCLAKWPCETVRFLATLEAWRVAASLNVRNLRKTLDEETTRLCHEIDARRQERDAVRLALMAECREQITKRDMALDEARERENSLRDQLRQMTSEPCGAGVQFENPENPQDRWDHCGKRRPCPLHDKPSIRNAIDP
jgi:hypothetical protein